eukprot:3576097-Rhodomonas_salina.4
MSAGLAGHVAPVAPGGGCVRPIVQSDKNASSFNKFLTKTPDWQDVKQGEKLKKGQTKTPKLVVHHNDEEADEEADKSERVVQSSGRSMSTPLAGGSRRALSILQQAQSSTG